MAHFLLFFFVVSLPHFWWKSCIWKCLACRRPHSHSDFTHFLHPPLPPESLWTLELSVHIHRQICTHDMHTPLHHVYFFYSECVGCSSIKKMHGRLDGAKNETFFLFEWVKVVVEARQGSSFESPYTIIIVSIGGRLRSQNVCNVINTSQDHHQSQPNSKLVDATWYKTTKNWPSASPLPALLFLFSIPF